MKYTYQLLASLLCGALMFSGVAGEQAYGKSKPQTMSVKVSGNCGMCKKRIESTLKDASGVESATWDKKTKVLTVTYQPDSTTPEQIKEKVVASGHDLEDVKAKDEVYEELPECCQYRQ